MREDARVEEVSASAFGLFGREDALRVLNGVVNGGGSVLVTGDPGAGKSSILKVADQLAQRRGWRVLRVTPTEFDRGLPFAGLAELIAQCPEGVDKDLPVPQRHALDVALQRAIPEGRDVDPLAVPLAVRGLLTRLAESEPVALVLDDLQWLDQASVGSLGFALRRIPVDQQRLTVLVSTRPVAGAGAELVSAMPEPRHDVSLPPLEDWAIGQLLRTRLGRRWTPPRSAGVARASSGNPFLALMIAEAMQSDLSKWHWSAQDGHDPVFPIPPSLTEILGEKVSLLPPDARDVLLLVSAAGRLTVPQLHGMVDEPHVGSALEAAADWDIATVGAGSVVSFAHPMLASAIYERASPAGRREAHSRLAEVLDDPVESARHRARTISAPDEGVALELTQAADVSRGRGAQQLAGELFEAAALATPTVPGIGTGFDRWMNAVDAYYSAGDEESAEAALDKAVALAVTPDQQAFVLLRRYRFALDVPGQRVFAERALRLAPTDRALRAEILYNLGDSHRAAGHGRLAHRLLQRALADAVALDRFDIRLAALNSALAVERIWGMAEADASWTELKRLVSSPELDSPSAAFAWIRPWVHSFFATRDDGDAEKHVRQGIGSLVDAGRYGDLSHLYIALVLVLIRSSRPREARAALDDADRLGAWVRSHQPQEDMARVLVHAHTGDLETGRELAVRALARRRIHGSAYWRAGFLAQLGFVEVSARNWQAALEPLREIAEIFELTGMVDLEQLLWSVDYADAALQAGHLDEVDAAISVLRRQAAVRPEAAPAADRCQALLTAARGDVDTALSELVRVIDLDEAESPFETARSRLALGQVYRRGGYKGLARQTFSAAAHAFDALGSPRWAERARDEAARVGLQPTTNTLTATERRVAELVGSGHTNQETAAELFMSIKTVEANLTRIYRKLSVRSRTELANRLSSLDSTPDQD
jgi:DNA-binding CsgD family transcriptional regulator/energy-coupling factor transporter ATP-binding protein EcfA2